MTVRRADDVVTEITLEGPASKWAHPDGTPINLGDLFPWLSDPNFPPCIKIGGEIMEIIRCVDIEEES